jgi:hypothetical protein
MADGTASGRSVLAWIAAAAVGRFAAFYGAIFAGIGGVILSFAWHEGPQKYLDARKFATLTARAESRIVESWLAVELDPSQMGPSHNWRASAKAAPCIVVEYDSGWTGPARRAFCGTRLPFHDHYSLHDLTQVAPGVPFAWRRDERGFIVPEIRLSRPARDYLATHAPTAFLIPDDLKSATELAVLTWAYERPDDDAIAGWSRPPPAVPIAIDPANPAQTLPVGFIEDVERRSPNWFASVFLAFMGFVAWIAGWRVIAGDRPWPIVAVVVIVPLLFLPWWGEEFPRWIRSMNAGFADVVTDMLGDVDRLDRLVASSPEDASLARGERIAFPAGGEVYAQTFGKLSFAPPRPAPANADAALDALAASIAAQMRTLDDDARAAIFARLARDKRDGRAKAGFAFLRAAREAAADPKDSPAVRNAAIRFLDAWVTQPVEEPYPHDLAFATRVALLRELMTLREPSTIATQAGWIVERAEQRRNTSR